MCVLVPLRGRERESVLVPLRGRERVCVGASEA